MQTYLCSLMPVSSVCVTDVKPELILIVDIYMHTDHISIDLNHLGKNKALTLIFGNLENCISVKSM